MTAPLMQRLSDGINAMFPEKVATTSRTGMTLPQITMRMSAYRITASIPGRVLAGAIRNQFGWWLPTSRKHQPLTWTACDTRRDAVVAVYEHAVRRLNGN